MDLISRHKIDVTDKYKLQITFKPTFFDPFAPRGYVNLKLSDIDNDDKASVECEIVPTSLTENVVYLLVFLLSMWTLVSLLISQSLYTFLTVFFGWTMCAVLMHLIQVVSQGKLENYITHFFGRYK